MKEKRSKYVGAATFTSDLTSVGWSVLSLGNLLTEQEARR